MNTVFAPDSQTWWDAVCNCDPAATWLIADSKIVSEAQYKMYQQIRDEPENENCGGIIQCGHEVEFMALCFLSYAFDLEQEKE